MHVALRYLVVWLVALASIASVLISAGYLTDVVVAVEDAAYPSPRMAIAPDVPTGHVTNCSGNQAAMPGMKMPSADSGCTPSP